MSINLGGLFSKAGTLFNQVQSSGILKGVLGGAVSDSAPPVKPVVLPVAPVASPQNPLLSAAKPSAPAADDSKTGVVLAFFVFFLIVLGLSSRKGR